MAKLRIRIDHITLQYVNGTRSYDDMIHGINGVISDAYFEGIITADQVKTLLDEIGEVKPL